MQIFFAIFIFVIVLVMIVLTLFISLPSKVLKDIENFFKKKPEDDF